MGVKDSFEAQTREGAYSDKAKFLEPTDERTLTWGDSFGGDIIGSTVGELGTTPNVQLIQVNRKRPTTFHVATSIQFGAGWTGENPVNVTITYFIGVGQTRIQYQETLTITTPTDNTIPVSHTSPPLPCTAMNCTVTFNFTGGTPLNPGAHGFIVGMLAAPVYA